MFVINLARQAELAKTKLLKDKFADSAPAHEELVGKKLHLTLHGSDHYPFAVDYRDGSLEMTFHAWVLGVPSAVPGASPLPVPVVELKESGERRRDQLMQNGFGAVRNHTFTELNNYSVGFIAYPDPTAGNYERVNWSASKSLPGAVARILYNNAVVAIDGEVSTFSNGSVTTCGMVVVGYDGEVITRKVCAVAVKVTRIRLVAGDGTTFALFGDQN